MKNPPPPHVLAQHLRAVAKLLDGQPAHNRTKATNGLCRCPTCRVHLLAARGWPSTTAGTPGTSSGSDTTPTEAAALTHNPFHGLDTKLTDAMRLIWTAGLDIQHAMSLITATAPDDDPLPAGAGPCQQCDHVCNSRRRGPEDRIRSGLCPACYQARRRSRSAA